MVVSRLGSGRCRSTRSRPLAWPVTPAILPRMLAAQACAQWRGLLLLLQHRCSLGCNHSALSARGRWGVARLVLGEGAPSRTPASHLASLDLVLPLHLRVSTFTISGFLPISSFKYLRRDRVGGNRRCGEPKGSRRTVNPRLVRRRLEVELIVRPPAMPLGFGVVG